MGDVGHRGPLAGVELEFIGDRLKKGFKRRDTFRGGFAMLGALAMVAELFGRTGAVAVAALMTYLYWTAVAREADDGRTVFLEIDGLALPVLRRAMRDGSAPNMARWVAEEGYQLSGWETDLSSQTGASQAGILLGSVLGLWFWYRVLPVPAALDDPFSPGRWTLIGIHIALIVLGLMLNVTPIMVWVERRGSADRVRGGASPEIGRASCRERV